MKKLSVEQLKFNDMVYNCFKSHGLNVNIDHTCNNGLSHPFILIEPTGYKGNKLDGMQILYTLKDKVFEVSEIQAGENNLELHIFKNTTSLKYAVKELLKGNNRRSKAIKIW